MLNLRYWSMIITLFAIGHLKAEEKPAPWAAQEAAALVAVEAYIGAFNARDARAFVDALHYPHTRIDGPR